MSRRASREARLLRGLAVATVGSGLAVAGHLVAGGAVPAHASILLVVALAAAACTVLSDQEWSGARLVAALGSIELLVHLGLRLDHVHGPAAPAGVPGPSGWLMLIGHVAAALTTGWLLRCGEQAYWSAVERLRRRPLPRPVVVPAGPVLVPAVTGPQVVLRAHRCVGTVSRRGPPALAA